MLLYVHKISPFSIQISYGRNRNIFYHICKMDTKTKQFLILYNYKIHLQTQINIRIEVMNTLINYRHQIIYFFPLNYFRANFLSLLRLWCIKPYLLTNVKANNKDMVLRTTNPYVFMSFARSMAHWECHNLNDVYLFTVFSYHWNFAKTGSKLYFTVSEQKLCVWYLLFIHVEWNKNYKIMLTSLIFSFTLI